MKHYYNHMTTAEAAAEAYYLVIHYRREGATAVHSGCTDVTAQTAAVFTVLRYDYPHDINRIDICNRCGEIIAAYAHN